MQREPGMSLMSFRRAPHPARRSAVVAAAGECRWARYLNAALGLWLFLSAFAWQHVPSSQINTCLVGLFVGISAITATGWSLARRLTASLALWLTFTTLVVYPARPATVCNNLLVAAAVLALSFVPYTGGRQRRQ